MIDFNRTIVEREMDGVIEKFRIHINDFFRIDCTVEAIIQMITNRGYSLESIRKKFVLKDCFLFLTFIRMVLLRLSTNF